MLNVENSARLLACPSSGYGHVIRSVLDVHEVHDVDPLVQKLRLNTRCTGRRILHSPIQPSLLPCFRISSSVRIQFFRHSHQPSAITLTVRPE
jgi:hypothetical protein